MNRWTTGSLYHSVPETVATKNVFRQKVLWTFPLYIFLSLHKGFCHIVLTKLTRYFIEYEYEEIHLFMILYLDL